MTLDDLVEEFRNHPTTREGVKAIVRALRDEVEKIWTSEDMGCGTILDVFNQILGSDAGNEKVGEMEGSHYTFCSHPDEHLVVSPTGLGLSPAPAPAVCVWRVVQSPMNAFFLAGCSKKPIEGSESDYCPSCGKPIKFTEAK